MAISHFRSKRKPSGGLIRKAYRKTKRIFEAGREPALTTIAAAPEARKLKKIRAKAQTSKTRGWKLRTRAEAAANVLDPKTQKVVRARILDVIENPANPHFVRLKILTKGATVKTEAGIAKITSRPGQDGVINAVLVEKSGKSEKTGEKK